jgi:hypothetical protein
MRIFLSVAGPDRPIAKEVFHALSQDGHDVFLDENNLPPGESYHRHIREAIERAELVVFFISPRSLEPSRYTMTELRFVEKKWPSPHGRVLPTLIAPMDPKAIPSYLRAVSLCKPQANIAAEVAYEVSKMVEKLRAKRPASDYEVPTAAKSPLDVSINGALAAIGLGMLAVVIGVLTNQLAPFLKVMNIPQVGIYVFHGASLTLLAWLAALLFTEYNIEMLAALAAGCIGAYLFEFLARDALIGQVIAMHVSKSMVFAACLAAGLSAFRSPTPWIGLAVAAAISGQLAEAYGSNVKPFIWEALLIASTSFCLALSNSSSEQTGRAEVRGRGANELPRRS